MTVGEQTSHSAREASVVLIAAVVIITVTMGEGGAGMGGMVVGNNGRVFCNTNRGDGGNVGSILEIVPRSGGQKSMRGRTLSTAKCSN